MSYSGKRFSIPRVAILLVILVVETALTVSLWADGWLGTGSHLRMIACAIAAALPLLVAAALLFRNRFRFGLRSLLAAMALVAVFMFFSVRPLLEARDARQASRLLALNGARLEVESEGDEFDTRIGHNPRPPRSTVEPRGAIPLWLKPLAGDLPSLPPDDAIITVFVENDAQALALCQMASQLKNLENIRVGPHVSPSGMELLRKTMPQFERLVELTISLMPPDGWLSSLTEVRSLFVSPNDAKLQCNLKANHLKEISELPNLEVFSVLGHGIADEDVQALSRSTSLRRILLRKTDVTEAGEQALSEAMPDCEIQR
jgi:hypothetical protein